MQTAKNQTNDNTRTFSSEAFRSCVAARDEAPADILNASDDEIARLLEAFRAITSMQQRMRVLEMAERLAIPVTMASPPAVPTQLQTTALDLLRQQQSLFQGNQ